MYDFNYSRSTDTHLNVVLCQLISEVVFNEMIPLEIVECVGVKMDN